MLRHIVLAALAAAFAAGAHADEIVLRVDSPIVEITVNDKPARMLVDPTLPDMMVFNPDAQARLGVRPVPMVNARAVFDDASIRARVARPKLVFANGKSSRAFTGLFGEKWSERGDVDGAMGPGVLPYDRVRIILRDGAGGTTQTFRLPKREFWSFPQTIAGEEANVLFSLSRQETMVNRALARSLDEARLLTLMGDVQQRRFFLGLTTTVQMAHANQLVAGRPMGVTIARTDAPLAGSNDVDVVTVTATAEQPQKRAVTLGRNALSDCYEFVWERAAGTLSLRCD
ncbi:MAG: hypothetical protein SGJ23_03410 [Alphaproteobacteria bacterium]|nr:hypothetical protein [Alphaproteobacteria bacterium]